jgi:hypothetical protein
MGVDGSSVVDAAAAYAVAADGWGNNGSSKSYFFVVHE